MHDSGQSDEELVVASLKEREAFGVLVTRYEQKLTRYLFRLGISNEDTPDVLQEIFIKAYVNLNSFDTNLAFSSWIYRIAHNETMSWFRKRSVRPEGHLIEGSEELLTFLASDEIISAEQRIDDTERKEVLVEALKKLETRYRDIIILRFFEHKEYEEISDILKIPIGTVGTLLHRAKKKLKVLIDTKQLV